VNEQLRELVKKWEARARHARSTVFGSPVRAQQEALKLCAAELKKTLALLPQQPEAVDGEPVVWRHLAPGGYGYRFLNNEVMQYLAEWILPQAKQPEAGGAVAYNLGLIARMLEDYAAISHVNSDAKFSSTSAMEQVASIRAQRSAAPVAEPCYCCRCHPTLGDAAETPPATAPCQETVRDELSESILLLRRNLCNDEPAWRALCIVMSALGDRERLVESMAVSDNTVAGALFDFLGFLTTLDEAATFGGNCNAGDAVRLLKEWAAKRNLNLDGADVMGWRDYTAPTAADARDVMAWAVHSSTGRRSFVTFDNPCPDDLEMHGSVVELIRGRTFTTDEFKNAARSQSDRSGVA
jgi:hypothetical protein